MTGENIAVDAQDAEISKQITVIYVYILLMLVLFSDLWTKLK
jgi:hypothetical protein